MTVGNYMIICGPEFPEEAVPSQIIESGLFPERGEEPYNFMEMIRIIQPIVE